MATLTTDNDFVELPLEHVNNNLFSFKARVEKLFDIQIKEKDKKYSLIGERNDVQKAQRYLVSLMMPGTCLCQIYDYKQEQVNTLEEVMCKVERQSTCHITKGDDCYFLIYGTNQVDITIATSMFDAAIRDDEYIDSVLARDLSYRDEEQMDFIMDDIDDDPLVEVSTMADSNSMDMSQMMEDMELESESSCAIIQQNNCTIDLRSDDDESDCIILSDNSVTVEVASASKKKKINKKKSKKNSSATQMLNKNLFLDPNLQAIKLISPNAHSTPVRHHPAPNICINTLPELARLPKNLLRPLVQPMELSPDSIPKLLSPATFVDSNAKLQNLSPNSSLTPTNSRQTIGPNFTMDIHSELSKYANCPTQFGDSSSFINEIVKQVLSQPGGFPVPSPVSCEPGPMPVMQYKNTSPETRPPKTGLRKIVIDGSNVAMIHGLGKVFSCRGIELVIEYFEKRGHEEIAVFVPQFRRSRNYFILEKLYKMGKLHFTPSRMVDGKMIASYDDRYILRDATDEGGIVISNDHYKDLYSDTPEFRETIEKRILQVTFVGDKVMFPDDPLGRDGPTLDEFLSHDKQVKPRGRHRSPMFETNRIQPGDNKSRSSSCKPMNRNLPLTMIGPSKAILQRQQQIRMPQVNFPKYGFVNTSNMRSNRPINPYPPNQRPPPVTEELRRALLRLPNAMPGRVNYILDVYSDCTDFQFLRTFL